MDPILLKEVDERRRGRKDEVKRGGDTHAIQALHIRIGRLRSVVAQKIEIELVPIIFDEINGTGDGDTAKIDSAVHIENDTALFRYLHNFSLQLKELLTLMRIHPIHIQVQGGTRSTKHKCQPIALFDFFTALTQFILGGKEKIIFEFH
jgi:hypothetical protein